MAGLLTPDQKQPKDSGFRVGTFSNFWIPLGWVHDVAWAPTAQDAPTLSVHAYSPPLTAMSYYEVTDRNTLRRKRTELTDTPEGQ